MSIPLSDGKCPGCSLTGAISEMRANSSCYLECPTCHVQVRLLNGAAVIVNVLGQGNFAPPEWYDASRETLPVPMYEHNDNWPRGAGPLIVTRAHLGTYIVAVRSGSLPAAR